MVELSEVLGKDPTPHNIMKIFSKKSIPFWVIQLKGYNFTTTQEGQYNKAYIKFVCNIEVPE